MEKIATHTGTVTHVVPGRVTVQMRVTSACASCEAHAKCGFADSKDKIVEIDTRDWQQYHPGDPVTVGIQSANGMKAGLIAYVMPALLLLGTFVAFYLLHLHEGLTALLSLLVVCLYGGILYLLRGKLQQKFTFRLKRQEQ